MYDLPYFKEQDEQKVMEFIHAHPFAFLCGCDKDKKPVATQIPVFIEERKGKLFLTGHMMRKTDHHLAFVANPAVLCIFTGVHTYVSATWYSDPAQASTWNYMSVHVKGQLRFLDAEGLVDILKKTTLHFENYNTASTTVFDNLPEDYRNRLMEAIAGFEVEVESMENVFKLSQNRDKESFENITEKLKEGDADARAVAAEMEKRCPAIFAKDI